MIVLSNQNKDIDEVSVQDRKKYLLKKMKDRGMRITEQRSLLLDILLEDNCTSCKEIYYKALKKNPEIGMATIYRMLDLLEELGVVEKKNRCQLLNGQHFENQMTCKVVSEEGTDCELSEQSFLEVLESGLNEKGYIKGEKIKKIAIEFCE